MYHWSNIDALQFYYSYTFFVFIQIQIIPQTSYNYNSRKSYNTENLGLINPVLIFQLMLCIIFFYYESILKKAQKGYYIIRNAYLYSTILLVLTCNMGEIAGRLATIFATCEIFIIPALSVIIKPRVCGYLICWILTAFLFFMNYQKLLQEPEYWNYFSLNI